jgi:GWxTD domain-containing protein
MAIKSNPERLEFIKEFWQRRNPNPASNENRLRDEHYRRISYSNARFSGTHPGWMTDRGRIYIVYGKPDSIDAHPSGAEGDKTPFETWRYRDFAVKFVDACKCGDYKLASPPKL